MRIQKRWSLSIVSLLTCPVLAAMPPLVDRVPANTIEYLGFAGTDALGPAYDKSHLKAVLGHTNFADVIHDEMPRLRQLIQDKNSINAAQLEAIENGLRLAVHHPVCVFIASVDDPGKPMPDAAGGVLIDAGDDTAELEKDFASARDDSPANPVQVGSLNHLFWIIGGMKTPFVPLHGGDDSLGGNPRLLEGQKHLGFADTPAVTMFLDIDASLKLADRGFGRTPDQQPIWVKVRDALGLTGVRGLSISAGFHGADFATEGFLAAPSPRRGLLAVVDPKPMDPALLAHVPANCEAFGGLNFDAGALYDTLKAAVSVTPEGADLFGKGAGAVNLFMGRNVRRQLLAPLGSQWVSLFSAANQSAMFNTVSDAKTLQDALTTATYTISNSLNLKLPREADGSPGAVASQEKKDGFNVTTITTKQAAPSWAIAGSTLVVASTPGDVRALAAAPAGANDTAKNIEALRKTLNIPATTAGGNFSYVDLPRTAPGAYERLAGVARRLDGFKRLFNVQMPDLVVPTLEQIRPELSPSVSMTWGEFDGVTIRMQSPFPGSDLLGASQVGDAAFLGGAALGTSVLLPSVNHARELANRVKSASNERLIGTAILMYANDHQGKYPATLGELTQTEDIAPSVFVSPLSDTHLPDGLNMPSEKSDWVNNHSEYVYVGAGLDNAKATPDTVVVYEKPFPGEKDGMNVLYGDGHVEWQKTAAAEKIRADHPAP